MRNIQKLKTSELIENLASYIANYGDLDVYILSEDTLRVPEVTHSTDDWIPGIAGTWKERGLKKDVIIIDGSLDEYSNPLLQDDLEEDSEVN